MGWLIFLRVVLSVSANAVQKRLLLNRAAIYSTWIITYGLMLGPAVIAAAARFGNPDPRFWRDIAIGGALDALGNLAMVGALRITDVSVFGPLNAMRPILALLFGWLFLRESPTTVGMVGVAVTVAGGVVLLAEPRQHRPEAAGPIWRALVLRISGLSFGVAGAVFLKRAVNHGSAELTVAAWIFWGLIILAGSAALSRRKDLSRLGEAFRLHRAWLLSHAVVFLVMQWITIRIFQGTLLAYSFVYFQLGMVLQVFVGRFFFREQSFGRRLTAAIIMAAGSVLILWKG